MIRLLIVVGLVGGLIYLVKTAMPIISGIFSNKCDYCEGKGFWRGTRGEKNHCEKCDGSGRGK